MFWDRIVSFNSLMKLTADAILETEGDNLNLSKVVKVFSNLEKKLEQAVKSSPLLRSEETAVMRLPKERKEFVIKPVHLASDLLDPSSSGSNLNNDEDVIIFLINMLLTKSFSYIFFQD